jgi:hypothetical protein
VEARPALNKKIFGAPVTHPVRFCLVVAIIVLVTLTVAPGQAEPQTAETKVLDVLRVQVDGNAANAVVTLQPGPARVLHCDVAIIGAGMGGTAAALAATREHLKVCLTEPTLWIGGQTTQQGVSAFDDNQYTDTTGGTATYLDFSREIREHYATLRKDRSLPLAAAIQTHPAPGPIANPGGCWVGRLCFEPAPAEQILESTLRPAIASGTLTLLLHTVPVSVDRDGRTLRSVLVYDLGHSQWVRLTATYFVDASELGDLLPLTGLPYRVGAEAQSETHERNAPEEANRRASQSFTYTFILENPINPSNIAPSQPKPAGYDGFLPQYTMVVDYGKGKLLTYGFFDARPNLPGSFWVYRRSVDAAIYRPGAFAGDRAMINWSSNDHCDANLLGTDPLLQASALQNAKRLSAGFAWWMQHEVPRDDGSGNGYPSLTLLPHAMGSDDGFSQHPYIRESRRILPLRTIVEEDLAVDFQPNARAAYYPDSVGIGWYAIDIHSCERQDFVSASKPYQIPLGALIARDLDNLLAASKDIGTTHITNGAYRLHPTEWSIGEAAGVTVAQAIQSHVTPAQIDRDPAALAQLQNTLAQQGHPIFWFDDVPVGSPSFAALQLAGQNAWITLDPATLHAAPSSPASPEEIAAAIHIKSSTVAPASQSTTWKAIAALGIKTPNLSDRPISRAELAQWLVH